MNVCFFIGRLTSDPELRFTAGDGRAVCNFNIAVPRPYTKDKTDFFRVEVWGKPAENCANYLVKGQQAAINGSIRNNDYEKDGQKIRATVIRASQVQFLQKPKGSSQTGGAPDGFDYVDDGSDDIPF